MVRRARTLDLVKPFKRAVRSGVEDRWHRPARRAEQVPTPLDAADQSAGIWCMDGRHGEPGTLVTTLKHGKGKRWLARWVDNDGQERTKAFDRRGEADRHIRATVVSIETGTYADPRRSAVTFRTVADAWLKTKEAANRAPKTIGGYSGLLEVVILPKWGDDALGEITHEDLQTWLNWLSTSPEARQHKRVGNTGGYSPARVIQIHQVVHQVFAYAIRSKYVAVNPADNMVLPSKPQSKDLALTHDQVQLLAEEMSNAEDALRHRADTATPRTSPAALATMVRFLAYSGLRFGECIALRVGDVDTDKRRVLVSKSITQVRGKGRVEGDTKTHQKRSAPILTTALNEELKTVTEDRDPAEFLFPGPDGNAMTIGWFRARFDKASDKAGLEGVTPHTLRHSAGSLALSEGASVPTVQKLLGHRNATTTMNVYSHMMPDDFDNLAAAMDRATAR